MMLLSIILLQSKLIVYNQISPDSKVHSQNLPLPFPASIILASEGHIDCSLHCLPTNSHLRWTRYTIRYVLRLLLYFLVRKEASPQLIQFTGLPILTRLTVSLEISRQAYIIFLTL